MLEFTVVISTVSATAPKIMSIAALASQKYSEALELRDLSTKQTRRDNEKLVFLSFIVIK